MIASQLPNPYSNMPTSNIESSGTSQGTPQWTLLAGAVRRNLKDKHRTLSGWHQIGAYPALKTRFSCFLQHSNETLPQHILFISV